MTSRVTRSNDHPPSRSGGQASHPHQSSLVLLSHASTYNDSKENLPPPSSSPRISSPPISIPQPKRFKNRGRGKLIAPKETIKPPASVAEPEPEPESKLPPNTICASKFLKAEELDRIFGMMPSLEAARTITSRRTSSTNTPLNVPSRSPIPKSSTTSSSITSTSTSTTSTSTTITTTTTTTTTPNTTKKPKSSHQPKGKDRLKELERNIDQIIFGNVTFPAWYPSWYPKEIIGEKALDGKGMGITVKELFVCKRCFGYSKEVLEWVRHVRCCEKGVPGRRVYCHGGVNGEEREEGKGGYSVWEVDGEVETLFCQNLSLFAKLFLDNKSVFFDVAGFNYFLLVHTNPAQTTSSDRPPNEQQIVGFFSKEKMSWDNNNLACILIFPPWQKKGLGALLMGVSYSIAKREGIMGGPEKPISELGRKGYKRYWGAEIARWLLECRETDRKRGRGIVGVEDVSRGTWISPEDCLGVLREMGVFEGVGRGKGEVERVVVDKGRVREWCVKERIRLERVVGEEGFLEGYALPEVVEGGEEEMEVVGE